MLLLLGEEKLTKDEHKLLQLPHEATFDEGQRKETIYTLDTQTNPSANVRMCEMLFNRQGAMLTFLRGGGCCTTLIRGTDKCALWLFLSMF